MLPPVRHDVLDLSVRPSIHSFVRPLLNSRCGPQPLQRISASLYRPIHYLGLCALPMLVVPRIHTELARHAFSVAAPSTWNFLPADIRLCENILTFKRHLETHLFKLTWSFCSASSASVFLDLKALYKSVIYYYYYYY